MQKNLVAEDKVSELSEEDVAVSYIGDELDLKTVGDIIAIIEEKVQRTSDCFFVSTKEINSCPLKIPGEYMCLRNVVMAACHSERLIAELWEDDG